MSQDMRRELIRRNLGIRPISHGQIYTFQIAIPDAAMPDITAEVRQIIESSLMEHQSNLVTLIVRRTTAYSSDDIEYEIVYGAEWLKIAQELGTEMVWAWVFDMTDEQALAVKDEMNQLLELSNASPISSISKPSTVEPSSSESSSDLEGLIDRKLQLAADSIKRTVVSSLNSFKDTSDEQLRHVNHRLKELTDTLSAVPALLEKIETLEQKLEVLPRSKSRKPADYGGSKVNLAIASDDEIKAALAEIGTQDKEVDSVLNAIQYWKQSDKGLTWRNLRSSVRARKGSVHKINGFGEGSYSRLGTIGELVDSGE